MEIEPPSRIAILGAGPIGLEAALYARSLGYEVVVYEKDEIAGNVRRWGHVRLFSPFGMNASPLGLAALAAQDTSYEAPGAEELLTGNQWIERYLQPLAKTDLVAGCIREHVQVCAIGRDGMLKSQKPGSDERAESDFRLLIRDGDGEKIESAGVVIDTTGVIANPNWAGTSGVPALGEQDCRPWIETGIPDVLGDHRNDFAGRRILVIGGGYSAATNVVALSELASNEPNTSICWITRSEDSPQGPITRIQNDRLAERDALGAAANRCAQNKESSVEHLAATTLDRIEYNEAAQQFKVQFAGKHAGEHFFDRVISNVGYRPDATLYGELQVHQCYASDGPMKLAAALLGETSGDCLDQTSHGAQTLLTSEPNFYILGAKSYGRNSQFLVSIGLKQIQELFSIIGGRENLDLYASVEHLVP